MKKIVLLGLVAVIALLTAGCDMFGSSNEQTPFEGKWQNFYAPVDLIYEFKGNTWKLTVDKTIYRGVFVFDDVYIVFGFTDGKNEETWKQMYLLSDDVLELRVAKGNPDDRIPHMFGPFERQ
jgi:hypothetical protein